MHAFEAVARPKMLLADASEDEIKIYVEEERELALGALTTFMARLPFDPGPWSPLVVEGEPVLAISKTVERLRPDLIVVGTQSRTGLAKNFSGQCH
ncbi:universal stress protein [Hyphomicrobium sp. CS1GBMeth3]|uniref:universal stress protein n=1 Tax=Hyphomicrobium sp. CS1GBMeth3 TaxID=1892845 RepID=UPI000931E06A|nr:universal stress protein [Hyphomicrobium sp. CS1GBMeth3]